MKRFLHALTVALLCLFIFAASASAECAWVLWAGSTIIDRPPEEPRDPSTPGWSPLQAFATQDACEKGQTRMRGSVKQREREEMKKKNGKGWRYHMYRCFPDTIDPREPKQ